MMKSTTSNYDLQAQIFKALSHPNRLAILDILREGEACVCHLEAALGYRQAYISQQLMILREAGLVQDRRDGWNIFYRAIKPEVFKMIDLMPGANASSQQRSKPKNCPCPNCNPETGELKLKRAC